MIEQTTISDFPKKLSRVVVASLDNHYEHNFDAVRFPGTEREVVCREKNLNYVFEHVNRFSEAYELLENEESKELYVLLTAFKILGHRKIRLPLSKQEYWDVREKLDLYVNAGQECIDAGLFDLKLHLTDLSFIGVPIKQYTLGGAILVDYLLKQYEYVRDDVRIGVKPKDVVIDAGACWGDTALYFAHLAGAEGRVFSFEFTQTVEVFRKNIALNPALASRISLIEKAVWKNSQDRLFFNDSGPSTTVSEAGHEKGNHVQSISIDDLVRQEQLEKVDFIKMDIEGAERDALLGARDTLRRFRPELAITIYHNEPEDFVTIPLLLKEMDLGYKFYISHFTIYNEETVLYAKV